MIIHHPNIPASVIPFLAMVCANYPIESLILFGSRAIGDHDERSDIDIAVCGSEINRLDWAKLREAAYEANTLYWISIVHYDRNPSELQERIKKTGEKIYVRTKITR